MATIITLDIERAARRADKRILAPVGTIVSDEAAALARAKGVEIWVAGKPVVPPARESTVKSLATAEVWEPKPPESGLESSPYGQTSGPLSPGMPPVPAIDESSGQQETPGSTPQPLVPAPKATTSALSAPPPMIIPIVTPLAPVAQPSAETASATTPPSPAPMTESTLEPPRLTVRRVPLVPPVAVTVDSIPLRPAPAIPSILPPPHDRPAPSPLVAPLPTVATESTALTSAGPPSTFNLQPSTAPVRRGAQRHRAAWPPPGPAAAPSGLPVGVVLGRVIGTPDVDRVVSAGLKLVRVAGDAYVTRSARHRAAEAEIVLFADPALSAVGSFDGFGSLVNPIESGGAITRHGPGIVRSNGIPIGGDHDPGTLSIPQ